MGADLIRQNLKKLIDQTRDHWHDLIESDEVDVASAGGAFSSHGARRQRAVADAAEVRETRVSSRLLRKAQIQRQSSRRS